MKKIQTGLRLSEELNRRAAEEAEKLEISKNDYILLAIHEKLQRDKAKEK